MWQLIGHPQKAVSSACPGCGKRPHGAWRAQWGFALDTAEEITELNSMISAEAPNWKPQKGPFFWDRSAEASRTSIGMQLMKGDRMASQVPRLKVIHPRDPQPLGEKSSLPNSSTYPNEVKKQKVQSNSTDVVTDTTSVSNFALPYAVVVPSSVESVTEGNWRIAIHKKVETPSTSKMRSPKATNLSMEAEDYHQQLVNECIDVLDEGPAVPR